MCKLFLFLECEVDFNKVTGKCYIAYAETLNMPVAEWSSKGPHRFYFNEGYNSKGRTCFEVPLQGAKVGSIGKGKGMGFVLST